MTLRGRIAPVFPLVHLGLSAVGLVLAIQSRNGWWLLWSLFFLYLFPPLCQRGHQLVWPLQEGLSDLSKPAYSPWWTTLQLQAVFNAAPSLEAILRLVPGVYSCWLRLWGSRIGRGVVWTPRIEISDRSCLDIGDHVVFGHRVALYSHVVDKRKSGETVLYLKRIRVGNRAFIGAGSRLAPGSSIPDDARLPMLTDLFVNQRFQDP